jgi:FkbM family methyltransferase
VSGNLTGTLRQFKKLLRKFGIAVHRPQKLPFAELKQAPRYQACTIDLHGKPFRIPDGRSFYSSYREIFSEHVYRFDPVHDPPIIVDCGSNYGTSLVYFKTYYPDARITAVEADPKIFEILRWNIEQRDYSNIQFLNKAITSSTQAVAFHHEGSCGGRIFTLESALEVFQVEPVSLDELICEPVDFLKIDIEGAETEALLAAKNLHNVPQLFVEYHSFKDADQTLGSLLGKLSSSGFRYYIHSHFCSPHPLTEEKLQLGLDLQLNIFAKRL